MKSKFLIACILIGAIGMQKARSEEPKSYSAAIVNFIDGQITSDAKKLDAALSDDALIKIPRHTQLVNQTKENLLAAMRKENGVVQNCTSSYQLIAKTDALILARVDFKYPEFTQHNFLTMEKANDQWKITRVYKVSENNEEAKSGAYPVVNTVY